MPSSVPRRIRPRSLRLPPDSTYTIASELSRLIAFAAPTAARYWEPVHAVML